MIVGIFIGNDKLELFADENIEIVSSITDSSDITKNTTDYSKGFTVPASDRNNAIFKHYYNATVDNTFDARIKVDGRIELDGLPFKSGKIRLEKVNVKSQKASSYSINFFGKLVNLKDKLKDDELSTLDLSDYNHIYSSNSVISGLQTGLFDRSIIYTMLSKSRYFYNSDVTDTTANNLPVTGLLWSDLKPSIKLIRIIEAIETKYNIVFSRDFFGRTEFDLLYLWLNNQLEGSYQANQLINYLGIDAWEGNVFRNATNDYVAYKWFIRVIPQAGYETIPYKIVVKNFDVTIKEIECTGAFENSWQLITGNPFSTDVIPFSYQFFIATNDTFSYTSNLFTQRVVQIPANPLPTYTYGTYATGIDSILYTFKPYQNLPKMKIIDFLKSVFQLFKLVIIQNDDVNIYVNTQVDYYSQGKLWDVTRYVDYESYDVNRGDILNEIDFAFTEPTTILNTQFKINNIQGYGDEYLKLTDENGELLDGNKLEIKPQFEQVVYERLIDNNDGLQTNVMYGLITDRELKPVNVKAHIFYNNIVNISAKPIKVINTLGSLQTLSGNLNTSSHTLNFGTSLYSTTFSEEFNEWDGSLISNNLYTNYYKDYIDSIFNIKRRNFSFSSILPLNILLALRLNDVLKIKEDYYRIDKFTSNITNNKVQLNLINAFDNTINPFATDNTIIFASSRQAEQTIFVKGNDSFTVTLVGISTWARYTITGRIITIRMVDNLTGFDRSVFVETVSGTKTITVEVIQQGATITADTTLITADTTLITADNG